MFPIDIIIIIEMSPCHGRMSAPTACHCLSFHLNALTIAFQSCFPLGSISYLMIYEEIGVIRFLVMIWRPP